MASWAQRAPQLIERKCMLWMCCMGFYQTEDCSDLMDTGWSLRQLHSWAEPLFSGWPGENDLFSHLESPENPKLGGLPCVPLLTGPGGLACPALEEISRVICVFLRLSTPTVVRENLHKQLKEKKKNLGDKNKITTISKSKHSREEVEKWCMLLKIQCGSGKAKEGTISW